MNLSKVEKIIIMVLVVGGILAAGFFFIFKPAYDGIGKAESNLKNAETAHADLMTKLERLNTIDDDIKTAKEDVADLEQKFYPDLTTYEAVEILLAQLKEMEMDTLGIAVNQLTTYKLELEHFEEEPVIYDLKTYSQNAKEVDENEVVLTEGQFRDGDKIYTITISNPSNVTITDDAGEIVEPSKFTETMEEAYKEAICKYAFNGKIVQNVSVIELNLEVTGEYKKYLEFIDYLSNFDRATYLPEVKFPMTYELTAGEDGKFYTDDGEEIEIDVEDGITGPVAVDFSDDDIVKDVPVKVLFYGVEQIEELENVDINGVKIVTNQ